MSNYHLPVSMDDMIVSALLPEGAGPYVPPMDQDEADHLDALWSEMVALLARHLAIPSDMAAGLLVKEGISCTDRILHDVEVRLAIGGNAIRRFFTHMPDLFQ